MSLHVNLWDCMQEQPYLGEDRIAVPLFSSALLASWELTDLGRGDCK